MEPEETYKVDGIEMSLLYEIILPNVVKYNVYNLYPTVVRKCWGSEFWKVSPVKSSKLSLWTLFIEVVRGLNGGLHITEKEKWRLCLKIRIFDTASISFWKSDRIWHNLNSRFMDSWEEKITFWIHL